MTFADFSPNPTGVSSGPLSATRVRAIESIVSWGTPLGSPVLKTSAPASCSSHSIGAPAASMIRRAAFTTSGPIPSPGIRVTGILSLTSSSYSVPPSVPPNSEPSW